MKTLGCIAYAKAKNFRRSKLNAKGIKCVFLNYCGSIKAYKLIYLEIKNNIKSRNVKFLNYKSNYKYLEIYPSRNKIIFLNVFFKKVKEKKEKRKKEKGVKTIILDKNLALLNTRLYQF